MSDRLIDLEGVGPAHAATLAQHGIATTDDLLSRGARPADRATLAEKSGISEKLILEWVNHADLCRIRGVAGEYADLLEEAGVDTVVELARRNPANLATLLAETNSVKNLTNRLPSASEVEDWVAQAKDLPRAVFYDDAVAGESSAPEPAAEAAPLRSPEPAPASAPAAAPAASAPRTITAPAVTPEDRGWLTRLLDRIRGR